MRGSISLVQRGGGAPRALHASLSSCRVGQGGGSAGPPVGVCLGGWAVPAVVWVGSGWPRPGPLAGHSRWSPFSATRRSQPLTSPLCTSSLLEPACCHRVHSSSGVASSLRGATQHPGEWALACSANCGIFHAGAATCAGARRDVRWAGPAKSRKASILDGARLARGSRVAWPVGGGAAARRAQRDIPSRLAPAGFSRVASWWTSGGAWTSRVWARLPGPLLGSAASRTEPCPANSKTAPRRAAHGQGRKRGGGCDLPPDFHRTTARPHRHRPLADL